MTYISKARTWLRIATAAAAMSFTLASFGLVTVARAAAAGEACLFDAKYGAIPTGGLVGHIGWGFLDGNNWVYGATEGVAGITGLLIPPGGNTNSWSDEGTLSAMLAAFGQGVHGGFSMGRGYYLQYRCAMVPDSNASAAESAVTAAMKSGYNLATDNCLDKAVKILQAYQVAGLPTPFPLEFPNNYFLNVLPSAFGSVQYFTTLTIAVNVVDPLDHQYLNTNPVHQQRPMRIRFFNSSGELVWDSGFSVMATVTPGKDRYQAKFQLPSPSPDGTGQPVWSTGDVPTNYLVAVQLLYTLPSQLHVAIVQGANNAALTDPQVTAGDINNDGHVDIADYNLLIQCFSDLSPPIGPCPPSLMAAADIDDDGHVNGTDYNEMLRVFVSERGS